MHLHDVTGLCRAVAERLQLRAEDVGPLLQAASLHDIGKAAIPDSILDKPGPLNADDWSFMCTHTVIGERILCAAPALTEAARLVRSSHERWNGIGIPGPAQGEAIPLGARIIAVCDAYDAMVSTRPYRSRMSGEGRARGAAPLRRHAVRRNGRGSVLRGRRRAGPGRALAFAPEWRPSPTSTFPSSTTPNPDLRGDRFHETMQELRERSWIATSEFGYVVLDREAAGFFLRSRQARVPGRVHVRPARHHRRAAARVAVAQHPDAGRRAARAAARARAAFLHAEGGRQVPARDARVPRASCGSRSRTAAAATSSATSPSPTRRS